MSRLIAVRDLPPWLSCFAAKVEHYVRDTYFCRGWRTLEALDREGTVPLTRLWSLGSVLFKPDSVMRGNAVAGILLLLERGASIRAVRPLGFSPRLVREFWRYALGRLSEDRVSLLETLMGQTRSLYALVSMADDGDGLPAAVCLTEMKGEVAPANRQPHHLRRAMGPPQTAVLNFVHTADEPADVVRELGLLFEDDDREAIVLEAAAGSSAAAAVRLAQGLTDEGPRSTLDLAATLGRVRQLASHVSTSDDAARAEVIAVLDRLARGERGLWPQAKALLDLLGVEVTVLDDLVVSGWTVPLRRPIPEEPFPTCERRHWEDYRRVVSLPAP